MAKKENKGQEENLRGGEWRAEDMKKSHSQSCGLSPKTNRKRACKDTQLCVGGVKSGGGGWQVRGLAELKWQ